MPANLQGRAGLTPFEFSASLTFFDIFIGKTAVDRKHVSAITNLLYDGQINVIADFKKLRYVNSTGLGILLHFSKSAKEKGGCFKIADVNENVYEIIEIIGAMSLLEIYDDVNEAIESLQ